MYSSFQLFAAVVTILATIYFLARRYETRMVLIAAGLVMCCIALKPMMAFDGFVKAMVTSGLIKTICSALGFAAVIKLTGCDQHLVRLILKPVRNIGFLLIPLATIITYVVNIAIPSAAGCAAAVGTTLIPLMMRAGVRPEMAAAAVFAGTYGGAMSPGFSHSAMIADMTNQEVMQVIAVVAPYVLIAGAITFVGIAIMSFVFKDFKKPEAAAVADEEATAQKDEGPIKVSYAIAPLVPLILLIIGYILQHQTNVLTHLKDYPSIVSLIKIGVPQAMILGAIFALVITWSSPATVTKKFFEGMGNGYGNVIGIIIAASVFAAGLEASGAIKWFIGMLTDSPNFARWGSTLGPFFMGMIAGSGDAAAMAFNKSVTPHALEIGYDTTRLGMAAALAAVVGRTASPIAGGAIVCAGLAGGINPIEIAKRTAPIMLVVVVVLALTML